VEAKPFVGPPKPEPEPEHASQPHGSWWLRHLHLRKPT
jgi:hypothetical protein